MGKTEWKNQTFHYAWRLSIGSLLGVACGFIDSLIVARYSTQALAGVALGAAIYELPINVLLGGLAAHRILAPQAAAKSRDSKVALRTFLPTLLAIAVFCCLALIGMAFAFANMFNPVTATALSYVAWRGPALIFDVWMSAMLISLLAQRAKNAPIYTAALTVLTNVLLDFVLVFGLFGAPRMGADGAGLATALSSFIGALFVTVWFYRLRRSPSSSEAADDEYRDWLRLSWPAMVSAALDYGGALLFTFIISLAGTSVLAGVRLGLQVHVLVFVLVSSLSGGVINTLGRDRAQFAASLRERMRELRIFNGEASLAVAALIGVGGWLGAPLVSADPQVVIVFRVVAVVIALSTPVAGLAYAEVAGLRLLKQTRSEMWANVVATWVFQLPVAGILVATVGGVWPVAGIFAYWVSRAVFSRLLLERYCHRT